MSYTEETSENESVDFALDEEDEALFDAEMTGDEDVHVGGNAKRVSAKKRLVTYLAKCPKCGLPLKTFDGYRNHLKSHIMEELFRSAPGKQAFKEECRRGSKDVIKNIFNSALKLSGKGEEVAEMATFLLSLTDNTRNIFVDSVASELWLCIPPPSSITVSKFHASFIQCCNHLMNDLERREAMLSSLSEVVPHITDSVVQLFFGHLFLKLCDEVETFYLKSLREPHECLIYTGVDPKPRSGDNLEDTEFQQSVHYIGGSVVRSILRVGLQSSRPKWVSVVSCITTRMLVGSLSSASDAEIAQWTESQDRGGLKFISQETWTFLMALSGVLKNCEERDGSVLQEKVISAVLHDELIMMLWKDVVGVSLCETNSEFLLKEVCRLFVNTWGRGVTLRLKNAIPKQSRDKSPLRMSLLRPN